MMRVWSGHAQPPHPPTPVAEYPVGGGVGGRARLRQAIKKAQPLRALGLSESGVTRGETGPRCIHPG